MTVQGSENVLAAITKGASEPEDIVSARTSRSNIGRRPRSGRRHWDHRNPQPELSTAGGHHCGRNLLRAVDVDVRTHDPTDRDLLCHAVALVVVEGWPS